VSYNSLVFGYVTFSCEKRNAGLKGGSLLYCLKADVLVFPTELVSSQTGTWFRLFSSFLSLLTLNILKGCFGANI